MPSLSFIAFRHLKSRHTFNFISLISYLSILGLGIGVCVLILTLSILGGFERQIENKIISFDGHIRLTGFRGEPIPEHNPVLDSVLISIPEITAKAPYIHHPAVIRFRSESEGVFVEGISSEKAKAVSGTPDFLVAGDFSFSTDESGRPGVVIGVALSDKLGLTTGQRVVLLDLGTIGIPGKPPKLGEFHIGGIYETGLRDYDESVVYTDLVNAQRLFGYDNQITGIILKLEDVNRSTEIADRIGTMAGYPFIPSTWKDRHYNLFSWLSVQKYPITIIFALISLVAIVNITSSLTMIVMEKTRDIGVLRAMGYTRRQVSGLFLLEGGIVGLLGVLLGTGLALGLGFLQLSYGLLRIPEDVYFMKELPILLEPVHFAAVGTIGFVLALIATVYPAWKASGIMPAEAVRYE